MSTNQELEVIENKELQDFESFDDDIKVLEDFEKDMRDVFTTSKDFLAAMMEASKRKGSGVSLAFIANQTANLSTIMSTAVGTRKSIIDAKQKRFNNDIKVNPRAVESQDDIPYALIDKLLERIPTYSGGANVIDMGLINEDDIDDELDMLLLEEHEEDVSEELEEELAIVEEPEDETDEDDLSIVSTEEGELMVIDSRYQTFNHLYEMPEERVEILFEDTGELYAVHEGEKIRVVDKHMLVTK